MAKRGGFEPPKVLSSPVFKTEFICFTINLFHVGNRLERVARIKKFTGIYYRESIANGKLMNHKDIKMTMCYAKLAPDSGRKSVVNLGF